MSVEAYYWQEDHTVQDPGSGNECPKQGGASDLKNLAFVQKNSRGTLVGQGWYDLGCDGRCKES